MFLLQAALLGSFADWLTAQQTLGHMFCLLCTCCCAVGGYVSGSFYARNDGRAWIRAMLLTGGFFPGACSLSDLLP